MDPPTKLKWPDPRRMRVPNLYDQWLKEEKPAGRHDEHDHDDVGDADIEEQEQRGQSQEGGSERAPTKDAPSRNHPDLPVSLGTTTTIVGGPAASVSPTSYLASSGRRLLRERGRRQARHGPIAHPPPPPPPPVPPSPTTLGPYGQHSRALSATREVKTHSPSRPRTRTMEESRMERSPASSTDAPPTTAGSVWSPPSVPTATRGRSPSASSTGSSPSTPASAGNTRRILHLMRTLGGKMSGHVQYRRGDSGPWTQAYCYVKEGSGSLMYEPRGSEGVHRTLIVDLRGCSVMRSSEDGRPHLEISLQRPKHEVHMRHASQPDNDAWFAALLWWQNHGNPSSPNPLARSTTASSAPEVPPRHSSTRQRTGSGRRKSAHNQQTREPPVIKVGKMLYWELNVSHGGGAAAPQPSASVRMENYGSRRWKRISGQLRENGELKLIADSDKTLLALVQLGQLSRCAVQRLDPSVLEDDFSIAIYPQYTCNFADHRPRSLRPIFLTLEDRVVYEVWFVLLRAFTMPQLYGPPGSPQSGDDEDGEAEAVARASDTTDMFRVERSLHIRIVEARMHPPTGTASPETGFAGGFLRGTPSVVRPDQHGYFAEVLLDNETRGKTSLKHESLQPLWAESFDFNDLPPVLNSASVVIKRRPPETGRTPLGPPQHPALDDRAEGLVSFSLDVTCGKVEIFLQELEEEKEVEKWWPIVNMYNHNVGEALIKARADEGVILMAQDYEPLRELLQDFNTGLTLHIFQLIPTELKRLSDCLLNINQVSGLAGDWIRSLVEDEIDGTHRETSISRMRYNRRMAAATGDPVEASTLNIDREVLVRDLNKSAALEANLLFRGNTLLTKSLDTHMRRIGREYLEQSLSACLRDINEKDLDCEVDPNKAAASDIERNWKRLIQHIQEVWEAIVASQNLCPVELRMIFRHIRVCAEDRYGDYLRSVSYSSVSGFLFLRFFVPAVLNPRLFGLLDDEIKPRARRTFTLIAKSLQTFANLATFGNKEQWMEPMNTFLTHNRDSFKAFIDDVCYVPPPLSESKTSPTAQQGIVSSDSHFAYTTPMTIMQRLPATSREGFPSLPYLIDQARAFADLVQLWVEVTTGTDEASVARAKQIVADVEAAGGPLLAFHETCLQLHRRTQDCLNRAERAERPPSAGSFQWEHMIDQLRMVEDYPERAPSTSPQRPVTRGMYETSTMTSDNDLLTTALPSYDREAGHRERREAAKIKIQQQLQARSREHEHEKRRKMPLAALRKGKNSRKETTE